MVRSAELDTYRAQAKIPSEKFKRLMGCYGSQLTSHERKKACGNGAESYLGWKKPWEHKKSTSYIRRKILRKNFNVSKSILCPWCSKRTLGRVPEDHQSGLRMPLRMPVVQLHSCPTLRPHRLQHARLPCPSPSPGACMPAKSLQSCLTLCDPMDCSPPGSSVPGIFQARILGWVAMPSSRGSSQPRDRTCSSCIAGGFLTTEPLGKPGWTPSNGKILPQPGDRGQHQQW